MRSRRALLLLSAAALLAAAGGPVQAAELSTLFTTPEERRIINSNRYKTEDVQAAAPTQAETGPPVPQLLREEVTREYVISGITLSPEGAHTVWINSKLYRDGDELDDRSKIKVVTGDTVRVRITLPDGQQYYATSGERLQVTYLARIEN